MLYEVITPVGFIEEHVPVAPADAQGMSDLMGNCSGDFVSGKCPKVFGVELYDAVVHPVSFIWFVGSGNGVVAGGEDAQPHNHRIAGQNESVPEITGGPGCLFQLASYNFV